MWCHTGLCWRAVGNHAQFQLPAEGAPVSFDTTRAAVEISSRAHVNPSSGGEPRAAVPARSSTPANAAFDVVMEHRRVVAAREGAEIIEPEELPDSEKACIDALTLRVKNVFGT